MAVLPQPPSSKVPTTTSVVVVACHNKNNAAVNNTAVFRLSRTAGALNLLDDFRLLAMPGFVSGVHDLINLILPKQQKPY